MRGAEPRAVDWLVSRLGRFAPLAPQPTTNRSRWLRCERSEPRNQPAADRRGIAGPKFLDQHPAGASADPQSTANPSPPPGSRRRRHFTTVNPQQRPRALAEPEYVDWLVSRLGRCAPLAPQPTTTGTRWLRCERSEPRNQPTADLLGRGPKFLDQHQRVGQPIGTRGPRAQGPTRPRRLQASGLVAAAALPAATRDRRGLGKAHAIHETDSQVGVSVERGDQACAPRPVVSDQEATEHEDVGRIERPEPLCIEAVGWCEPLAWPTCQHQRARRTGCRSRPVPHRTASRVVEPGHGDRGVDASDPVRLIEGKPPRVLDRGCLQHMHAPLVISSVVGRALAHAPPVDRGERPCRSGAARRTAAAAHRHRGCPRRTRRTAHFLRPHRRRIASW